MELKRPADEHATLDRAYTQLQTYKSQIGSLFRANPALVISDGIEARIGSLTAGLDRFLARGARSMAMRLRMRGGPSLRC